MSSTRKAWNGFGKGQKRVWKGAKTGLERGQKRVLKGAKTGFKRHNKRNLAKFGNLERARTAPRPLSTSFQPFFHRSTPFFTRFSRFWPKTGKKGCQKLEERERKETASFPFLSRSRFFPFLSRHISSNDPLLACVSGILFMVACFLHLGVRGRPLSYRWER